MRIVIVGAGPAGLYFAILMKKLDASHRITILERDGPHDTFGWGIVFSDQTFSYLKSSDESSFRRIVERCETWDNVDVIHRGQKISVRGNRFSGIARLAFLNVLQQRAIELGVDIRFHTNVSDVPSPIDWDLLVGADGANSLVRRTFEEFFQPTVDIRKNKYVWLGAGRLFHGLTLIFRQQDGLTFAAHAYKFNKTTSTFIVECTEETWRSAGLDRRGEVETCEYLQRVFSDDLGDQPLLTNSFVRWLTFVLVRNGGWCHRNLVLLGDAAHTAHFSIGSGTKLALEDAIALAQCFERTGSDVAKALPLFQDVRKPIVDAYQDAAMESLLWFENMSDYLYLDPLPFTFNVMTRSKKIDYEKLKKRDPDFIAAYEAAIVATQDP